MMQIHSTAQRLDSAQTTQAKNMGAGGRQRAPTMTHYTNSYFSLWLAILLENNIALQRSPATYLVKIRNRMALLKHSYS